MTHFRPCRKRTLIEARRLTKTDVHQRHGLIQTLEGSFPFNAGDLLAYDAKGEWAIPQEQAIRDYVQVTEPNEQGYAQYQALDLREAWQSPTFFKYDGFEGKAGDYLVRSQGRAWIVDQALFEATYVFVEEQEHA